jgi:hypothetical protein
MKYLKIILEDVSCPFLSRFVQGLDLGDEGLLVGAGHCHTQHQLQEPLQGKKIRSSCLSKLFAFFWYSLNMPHF